jgi:beta-mannosidase
MTTIDLTGPWELSQHTGTTMPIFTKETSWVVSVPGEVHVQLHELGVIPDPMVEKNFIGLIPMEKNHWWYRRKFTWEPGTEHPVFLVFEGIDVRSEVFLNGGKLGDFEGMFAGPEYEVTSCLLAGENEIVVHILPPETDPDAALAAFQEGHSYDQDFKNCSRYLKPSQLMAGNYFVRLVTAGIWLPVRLEARAPEALSDCWVETIEADASSATIRVSWERWGGTHGPRPKLTVTGPYGGVLEPEITDDGENAMRVRLANPDLWYPNGHGEQPLYQFCLACPQSDSAMERRIGIRTIAWRRNSGTAHELTLVVNGVPVYLRGANHPGLDKMLRLRSESYQWHIRLLKDGNFNSLRFWSGYAREDRKFYDLCDEHGIVLLHDLPVCNVIDATKVDHHIYRLQICRLVRDLRSHACLVAWMGGNELLNAEVRGHPLWDLCEIGRGILDDLDPRKRYFYSSYSLSDGLTDEYDHFGYHTEGTSSLQNSLDGDPKLSVEFWGGNHSFLVGQSMRQIVRFLPEASSLWPPPAHIHFHRINNAPWNQRFNKGFTGVEKPDPLTAAPFRSWEELMYFTRVYAGFALFAMIGTWRSRLFYNSGSFPWCWHDQCVSLGSGLVDGYGAPKALYYFVRRAFAPISIVMKFKARRFDVRDRLRSWVRVINESGTPLRGYRPELRLYDSSLRELFRVTADEPYGMRIADDGREIRTRMTNQDVASGSSEEVYDLNGIGYLFPLYHLLGHPSVETDEVQAPDESFFSVMLTLSNANGELISQNYYPFNFDWHRSEAMERLPQCDLRITTIAQDERGALIEIENLSEVPAIWAGLECLNYREEEYFLSDNYFALAPGQSIRVVLTLRKPDLAPAPLRWKWEAVNGRG